MNVKMRVLDLRRFCVVFPCAILGILYAEKVFAYSPGQRYYESNTGLTWYYSLNLGKAIVERYGEQAAAVSGPSESLTGGLVVPNKLNGAMVEGIGAYAFLNCKEVTSIVIPSGVYVSMSAFDGCESLTNVKFNGSSSYRCDKGIIYSGGYSLERCCPGVEVAKIAEGIEYISGGFSCCEKLKEICVPSSVRSISMGKGGCSERIIFEGGDIVFYSGAFEGWRLGRVEVANLSDWCSCQFQNYSANDTANPLSIAHQLFVGGELLENLIIPDNVEKLNAYTFSGCTALRSVIMPMGVKSIGAYLFDGCSNLRTAMIPESIENISYGAFRGCANLKTIYVMKGDGDRVRSMLSESGFTVTDLSLIEYVPMPVISPKDMTVFDNAVKISISNLVAGGTIHFTTDGSDPTIDSPIFKKFTATGKMTIKAITEYDGMVSDIVVSRIGLGRCEQPQITSFLGRNFTKSGNVVSISCGTAGAEVHYTIDGEMPTVESPLYTGPFEISETMTVRAAALNHPQYLDSEEAHESFTREWIRVDTPFINAPSSFADKAIKVTIGCSCEGATIYYTTDGSDPMANGLICTGEFEITDTTAIRAVAIKNDYLPSYEAALTIVKKWTLAEAINVEGLPVSSEKPNDWLFDNQVAHDGRMSVRSGEVPDDEAVDMRLSINGVGKLSFWWKVSCEETDMPQICWWDYGTILIDGVEVAWIDGETDWEHVEVEVPEGGEHQIVWRYSKDSDGHDGEDCLWIDEVSWTPKEVIGDLAQLSDVFGAGSEIVQCVKSDAELSSFNSFLSSCGVSQASSLSEAQKKWAYRSFKLSSIMVSPIMFEAEPELKIDTFSPAGSDWSICISLSAGGLAVEMAKDKLKERIRVGTSVEDICIQPNILAMPSADGAQLQFTIELPRGLQGFATVRID